MVREYKIEGEEGRWGRKPSKSDSVVMAISLSFNAAGVVASHLVSCYLLAVLKTPKPLSSSQRARSQ